MPISPSVLTHKHACLHASAGDHHAPPASHISRPRPSHPRPPLAKHRKERTDKELVIVGYIQHLRTGRASGPLRVLILIWPAYFSGLAYSTKMPNLHPARIIGMVGHMRHWKSGSTRALVMEVPPPLPVSTRVSQVLEAVPSARGATGPHWRPESEPKYSSFEIQGAIKAT